MELRWIASLVVGLGLVLGACGDDEDGGTPCDNDGDCDSDSQICESRECAKAECTENTDCATGSTCANGRCNDPYWAVGPKGVIVRGHVDGNAELHDAAVSADLFAIACLGREHAWAVGDQGTMLVTHDGGEHFAPIATNTLASLYDVDVSDDGQVAAVGTGLALFAVDGAVPQTIEIPGTELRGVYVGNGSLLAVGDGGAIRHWDGSDTTSVDIGHADLLSVDGSAHSLTRVAVGRSGRVLWSTDGGDVWARLDSASEADLHAVQMAHDGSQALAVGDSGSVVLVTEDGAEVQTSSAVDLRALHLHEGGRGVTVGVDGVILLTSDAGASMQMVGQLGVDLLGVDSIGAAHSHW